jgi:hypothetical protein
MKRRTIVSFPYPKDFWSQVENWAAETGFTLTNRKGEQRLYRKGHRLLMAPIWVEFRREGKQVVLEAWVVADMFLILSALAGKKPETGIESGGMTAMLPRRRGREAVNILLRRLNQKPIT